MNIRRGLPRLNRLERLERAGHPGHSCPASFTAPELAQPIVGVRVPDVSALARSSRSAPPGHGDLARGLTEDRAFDAAVFPLFFQQIETQLIRRVRVVPNLARCAHTRGGAALSTGFVNVWIWISPAVMPTTPNRRDSRSARQPEKVRLGRSRGQCPTFPSKFSPVIFRQEIRTDCGGAENCGHGLSQWEFHKGTFWALARPCACQDHDASAGTAIMTARTP